MKNYTIKVFLALFLVTLFIRCNTGHLENTVKLQPNDPFKTTITAGQEFNIDAKQDNVVEGTSGTILVFPKGCFKNGKGESVTGNVKVELTEALTLQDMLLSNLTTTSNGKPLESGGMIYFNATANGEQLAINDTNPVHIEIPTPEKKAGMMAYKGIRDEKGNMNWVDPKPLDKFLIPVNIDLLDFLPDSFRAEVDKGMPFANYKVATDKLTDSLYYSLSALRTTRPPGKVEISQPPQQQAQQQMPNEAYYNKNKEVVKGKYTDRSYDIKPAKIDSTTERGDTVPGNCGIDPAMIEALKTIAMFKNTLIATREFEARLRVIFKTCNSNILKMYATNTDKNLYELDSMAALMAGKDHEFYNSSYYHDAFYNFSQQRLTNVKNANKYAGLLKNFFEKRLLEIKAELEKKQQKLVKALEQKDEKFQEVAKEYKKVLQKREKDRMTTYGFNWTQTGWINVDNGTIPKTWNSQPLEVTIDNGSQFDRVYTYIVYNSIKSLYRLNSSDNKQFYVGNDEDKQMLMPNNKPTIIISIGYKDEKPSSAFKEFETGSASQVAMTLLPTTLTDFRTSTQAYDKYGKENSITAGLSFMDKYYTEQKRQKELERENEFMFKLRLIAYPCCRGE